MGVIISLPRAGVPRGMCDMGDEFHGLLRMVGVPRVMGVMGGDVMGGGAKGACAVGGMSWVMGVISGGCHSTPEREWVFVLSTEYPRKLNYVINL